MIIDAHVHMDTYKMSYCLEDLKRLEDSMDKAGIDISCVMSTFGPDENDGDFDYNFRRDTEILLEATEGKDHLVPMAIYDERTAEEDLLFLETILKDGRIRAVKYITGYQHFYPSDEEIKLSLQLLEENDVAAMFHTGTCYSISCEARQKYCCNPLDHIDDIAAEFPNLRINCAHFNSPNFLQLAPVFDLRSNVYADLSGLWEGDVVDPNTKQVDAYIDVLKENLYGAMVYLTDLDRIMFGSDRPVAKQDQYVYIFQEFLEEYGFTQETREKIFSENAKNFYKIGE